MRILIRTRNGNRICVSDYLVQSEICKYCTWQISAILIERTCTGIEYPGDKLGDREKLKSNREKYVKWLGKKETTYTANLKENLCQRV